MNSPSMPDYAITTLKILVAIPTYKRAGNVPTLSLFDNPVLFVDTAELEQYRAEYPNATIVEYVGEGGLTPKLEFILDYALEQGYDAVFKIDDDFEAMGYFAEGYTDRTQDRKRIYNVLERTVVNALDAGTPLFSFLQVADIRKYKGNMPFNLFATLKLGAYGIVLLPELKVRFDRRFVMKQDIDFCLQTLMWYRLVWIENRYSFYCKPTMGTKGGVASYRTRDRELAMMELLRKKWGSEMFGNSTSDRASIYTLNIVNPFK